MIVDFHSHVLPRIDDGSKNLEMTTAMLKESKKAGVQIQVVTPHFYADQMIPDRFLEKREKAFMETYPIANRLGIKLIRGVEVAFIPNMSEWNDLDKLCIEGTNLLLIEMPFAQWKKKDIDEISNLTYRDVRPVIAHFERFVPYQKDRSSIDRLIEMNLIYQFNCENLLSFFSRGKQLKLMNECDNVVLGTDAHNMDSRKPNLKQGREVIKKRYGEDYLRIIDDYSSQLLAKSLS